MIEIEIFSRRIIRFDKLGNFGFIRQNGLYQFKKRLVDDMVAEITVTDQGEILGRVIDTDVGEEYVNHRLEDATGAFVVGIRNAYKALLQEIADAVSDPKHYVGNQACRLDAFINNKYGVFPEFLWEKFPHFGVYRNQSSRKWFAIIMNINKTKVIPSAEGEVEVVNLKLGDHCAEYIEKGAHPSYHMNHCSWVTVLLDDTLNDDLIEEMLEISYRFSVKPENKKKR